MNLIVTRREEGLRLDQFLAEKSPSRISRSAIQRSIRTGRVLVNGERSKPSYKIKVGDSVFVDEFVPQVSTDVLPEPIPLNILYEDSDIIVVNKSAGMIVHPIPSHQTGTLVNALLYHCRDLKGVGGELRPGIVHRLDKDTSGVIVVAKNDLAHISLSKQFKDRTTAKMYLTIVRGKVEPSKGVIDEPISRHPVLRTKMMVSKTGRASITHFQVLRRFRETASLMAVYPKTGRTHQIRVHMNALGHPVLGDALYGRSKIPLDVKRQMLHAAKLSFTHPRTGKIVSFCAPLPEDFKSVLRELFELEKEALKS